MMSALHMPGKLAITLGALVAPLCVFLARDTWVALRDLQQIKIAAAGVGVSQAAISLNHSLNNLSTLTQANLAGDTSLAPALQAERQRVSLAVAAMQAAFDNAIDVPASSQWPGLQRHVLRLANGGGHVTSTEADGDFQLVLNGLRDLMHQTSDRSHIASVAGPGGPDLVKLMSGTAARLVDATSELNRHGVIILARRGEAEPHHLHHLIGAAWSMERDVSDAQTVIASLARHGIDSPGSWTQAVELVEQLVARSRNRFTSSNPGGSALAFHDVASVVLDQLVSVQQDSASRLLSLIEAQRQQRVQQSWLLGGLWAAGALLIAYITTVYVLSSWGALRQLTKAMRATSTGDFSHRVRVWGQDELAELAQAFDEMNERLSNNTADIRSRAARVDQSSRQVAEGNQHLAQRTDEQAQNVGNTLRAFAEVANAVSHNAQATRELDDLTNRLFTQAENGNVAMAETVMVMDELDGASARVAEMVAVIDDVAFQTGMLALNASVEAARAGPAGKGFSVVAGEVRQLALRCAEAADEIRGLTESSAAKVKESTAKLQHVSVAIDQLVNGVREVSGQLRNIATASTQQSAALIEVEANMESIQAITRDNAALVEQSSSATHALLSMGDALTRSVSGMRLRHGSADEARAMVEVALAFKEQHGRTQALTEFNGNTRAWTDRDLFIYCIDRSGIILANAQNPKRVGLSVDTLDGLRGTHHSERLWDCVLKSGSGWVRYQIVHPVTGTLHTKESYVSRLDDTTLIGCGYYGKADDDIAEAAPHAAAERERRGLAEAIA